MEATQPARAVLAAARVASAVVALEVEAAGLPVDGVELGADEVDELGLAEVPSSASALTTAQVTTVPTTTKSRAVTADGTQACVRGRSCLPATSGVFPVTPAQKLVQLSDLSTQR